MGQAALSDKISEVARNMDERGRTDRGTRERRHSGRRRSGYIATIIVNLVLLYIVDHLLAWQVPFLTESFIAAQWVIALSLWAGIAGNALLLAYDAPWFRHLLKAGMNAFSFAANYTVLVIFPFDFGLVFWDQIVRLGLIIGLVVTGVVVVVEAVQALLDRRED